MLRPSLRLLNLAGHFRPKHAKSVALQQNLFMSYSTASKQLLAYNKMHNGIALNPHPSKRDKGGEDAATITESYIALADGVGGWAENGVDPARYSRQLCKNISALIMYDGG